MILLQSTWLDIQCFNLVFRSTPYSNNGILVYADDFRISNEVILIITLIVNTILYFSYVIIILYY